MCLGCGARRDKADLLRLVAREGRFLVDRAKLLPGRGGYLCPRAECAARFMKLREDRLRRLFRSEAGLGLEGLEGALGEAINGLENERVAGAAAVRRKAT